MAKYLTITEARNQLLGLPNKLTDELIIITKDGKSENLSWLLLAINKSKLHLIF